MDDEINEAFWDAYDSSINYAPKRLTRREVKEEVLSKYPEEIRNEVFKDKPYSFFKSEHKNDFKNAMKTMNLEEK